ncbi:MAG TPA: response regulator [Candidatus Dormibacteraeota bacterium]|nr:response regulator [Candidatus Dormibacteraeota bacterium]
MSELAAALQNLASVAFFLLGVGTAVSWARRRDPSLGFLALAIVLLSTVSVLGRIQSLLGITSAALTALNLLAFVGSSYALLRFRAAVIPLPTRWHAAAVAAMLLVLGAYGVSQALGAAHVISARDASLPAFAILVVWAATVIEPVIRFWVVARGLPAVQAWRLRSLSLGFAGIVAILAIAIGARSLANTPLFQVLVELCVLAIVPLLFVSFSPPAWLRRTWRAAEEDGLGRFMQDLLILERDANQVAAAALEWPIRLVGGEAAATFDGRGRPIAVRGLEPDEVERLGVNVTTLPATSRIELRGSWRTVLAVDVAGTSLGVRLVIVGGPFSPGFGPEEITRVQQFMAAVATAIERSRLLDELKVTNVRLREATAHKSVFLASMSHELRTPLNAVLGFSELLLDAPERNFSLEQQHRFLQQIHNSGKHLLGLINDVLDLAKVEAGHMELRVQAVAVAGVVDQVMSIIEPLAAQKQIHVSATTEGAGEVVADAGKLKQMLLNLVSNAIKFTPEGGSVTLAARRLADRMEVAVTDSGIGIAETDLKRIFGEFQQVDSGIGRQQQGTGLGLSLTRRFAMLHGGDVTVQSTLGKSSTFTLTLPLQAVANAPVRTAPPADMRAQAVDAARPLVLVVEDDSAAAELIAHRLDQAGFRTEVVPLGADVPERARVLRPVAITLDILLPDFDGWQVLTRLKQDPATSAIPVIVVSIVDEPRIGLALGALDYFVKPVDTRLLVDRLKSVRDGSAGKRKVSVLVVDDESSNRDWVAGVLQPAGFEVILASGGREGIELATSRRPDLVLLDLMMPDVTGFEVVKAIRSQAATRDTPIVILTAKDLTGGERRSLEGEVSTVLSRGSTGSADLLDRLARVASS